MSLGTTLAQELQASLGKIDHLTLVVLFWLVRFGFDLLVRNLANHLNDIVGLANQANQFLIFRLQKLKQCPDGDMLERGVTAAKEPAQVTMNSTIRLSPCLDEN